MKKYTDSEMIDFLEGCHEQKRYTGLCCFRWSKLGRGWRLHETSDKWGDVETFKTVREAISAAMDEGQ